MKTATIFLCIAVLGTLAFFASIRNAGSKPVFYAKVIAKKAGAFFKSDTVNWENFEIKLQPLTSSYSQVCQEAKNKKQKLSKQEIVEAGKLFETILIDEIIPYWYGTPWDFYGHTEIPGEGTIACGYFVSTTLQHIGVNLNRYQLAQQTPKNEAMSLAVNNKLIEISGSNSSENQARIKKSIGDGICFVGLGNSHVGYLMKRKDELFFIHSSYISPGAVTIELAGNSPVFSAYDKYYIVELSNNKAFIQRWLNNERIEVIKNQ